MAVCWTLVSCIVFVFNGIVATALKIGLSATIGDQAKPPSIHTISNTVNLFLENIQQKNLGFDVSFVLLYDDGTLENITQNYLELVFNYSVDALLGPVHHDRSHQLWHRLNDHRITMPYVMWSSPTWVYFLLPYENVGVDPVLEARSFLGVSTTGGRVPHWSVLGEPNTDAPASYGFGKMWDIDGPIWTVKRDMPASERYTPLYDVNVPFSMLMDNGIATFPGRNASTVVIIFYATAYQVLAGQLFEKCYRLGYADVISFELGMSYENELREQNIMLSPAFANSFTLVLGHAQSTATVLLHMAQVGAQPLGIMILPHQYHLLRALEGHTMVGVTEPLVWAPPVGEIRPSYAFGTYDNFTEQYIDKYWDSHGGEANTFELEFEYLGEAPVRSFRQIAILGQVGFSREDFRDYTPLSAIQLASAAELIVRGFEAGNQQAFDLTPSNGILTLLGRLDFSEDGKRKASSNWKSTLTRQWVANKTAGLDANLLQSGLRYLSAYLNFTKESVAGDPHSHSFGNANPAGLMNLNYPIGRWNDKESLLYPCETGCVWLGYRCKPCDAGQHRDYHFAFCRDCPEGRYQLHTGEANCHACPEGGICTIENRALRPLVKKGYFRVDRPDRVEQVHKRNFSKPWYEYCQYNVTHKSFVVVRCPTPENCAGQNNTCRGLNKGFACGSCQPGSTIFHLMPGLGECLDCWSTTVSTIVLAMTAVLFFAVVILLSELGGKAGSSRKSGCVSIIRTVLYDCYVLAAIVEAIELDNTHKISIVMLPIYMVFRPYEVGQLKCWIGDGVLEYIHFLVDYSVIALPFGAIFIVFANQAKFFISDVLVPSMMRIVQKILAYMRSMLALTRKGDTIYALAANNILWKQSLKKMTADSSWTMANKSIGMSPIERIAIVGGIIYGLGADHKLYKQSLSELTQTSQWNIANAGESAGGGLISIAVDGVSAKLYGIGLDRRLYTIDTETMTMHSRWVHVGKGALVDVCIVGDYIYGFLADKQGAPNKRVSYQLMERMTTLSLWEETKDSKDKNDAEEEQAWHVIGNAIAFRGEKQLMYAVGSDNQLYEQEVPQLLGGTHAAHGSKMNEFRWCDNNFWYLVSSSIDAIDVSMEVVTGNHDDGGAKQSGRHVYGGGQRHSQGYASHASGHKETQTWQITTGAGGAFSRANLSWSNKVLALDIVRAIIAWLIVSYAPLLRMYSYILSCVDDIEGNALSPFLRMDYDISCDDEDLKSHQYTVATYILVYTHLLPVLLFVGLWYFRNSLNDIEVRRVVAIMTDGYKGGRFWYDTFVLLRTGWLIFFSQVVRSYESRLVVVFGFTSVSIFADTLLNPWENRDCSMLRRLHLFFLLGLWFLVLLSILEEVWESTLSEAGIADNVFGLTVAQIRQWYMFVFALVFACGVSITVAFKACIQDLDIACKSGFVVSDSVRQLVWIARKIWGLNEIQIGMENGQKFVDTSRLWESERVALVRCIQDVLQTTAGASRVVRPVAISRLIEDGFDKALSSRLQDLRCHYDRYGLRKKFKVKCGFQNCFSVQKPDPDIREEVVSSVTVQELQYAFQDVCATYDPKFVDDTDYSSLKEERILRKIVNVWKETAPFETIVKDLQDADQIVYQCDVVGSKGLHHVCSAWNHDFESHVLSNSRWTCMNTFMSCGCTRTRNKKVPKTIRISGAKGPNRNLINGLYSLVPVPGLATEFFMCNDKVCWQKHDDSNMWLLSFSNHRWYVCNSTRKAAAGTLDERIGGLLECVDDAAFPTLASNWRVWSNQSKSWMSQRIQVLEAHLEEKPQILASSPTHHASPIHNIIDYELHWARKFGKVNKLSNFAFHLSSSNEDMFMTNADFHCPGATFPVWVQFELPKASKVMYLEVKPTKSAHSPKEFEVEVSDKPLGPWTTFRYTELTEWDVAKIFMLDGSFYQHFKLKFLSSFNSEQPSIDFVKFYTEADGNIGWQAADEEEDFAQEVEASEQVYEEGEVDRYDLLYFGAARKGPIMSRDGERFQSFICKQCGFEICDACWEEMADINLEGLEVTVRRLKFLNRSALTVVTTPVYVRVSIPHKTHIPGVGFETRRLDLSHSNDLDSDNTSWEHCGLVPGFMSGDPLLFELYKEPPNRGQESVMHSRAAKFWHPSSSVGSSRTVKKEGADLNWKVAEDRFLKGKEILMETMTIDEAKKKAMQLDMCDGFYFSGPASIKARPITFVQDGIEERDTNEKFTSYVRADAYAAARKLGSAILPNRIFLRDNEGWKGDLGIYDSTGTAWATLQVEVQPIRRPPTLMKHEDDEVKLCLGSSDHQSTEGYEERLHRLREQIVVTDREITELAREIHKEEQKIVGKSQKEMVHGLAISTGDKVRVRAEMVLNEHISIHHPHSRQILAKDKREEVAEPIKLHKNTIGEVILLDDDGDAHIKFEDGIVHRIRRKYFHKLELQAPPTILISGVEGEFSHVVNGSYQLQRSTQRYKWHWQKKEDPDKWLLLFPNNRWYVCNSFRKDKQRIGGFLESVEEGVAFPTLVSAWRVWSKSSWMHQMVTVKLENGFSSREQLQEIDPVNRKYIEEQATTASAEQQLRAQKIDGIWSSAAVARKMDLSEEHHGGDGEETDAWRTNAKNRIEPEKEAEMVREDFRGHLEHPKYEGNKRHCHLILKDLSGSSNAEISAELVVRGEKEDIKVLFGGKPPRIAVDSETTILHAEDKVEGEIKGKLYKKGVAGDIRLKLANRGTLPWKHARLKWGNTYANEDYVVSSPRNLQDVEYDFHDICLCKCPLEAIHRMRNAGYRPVPIYSGKVKNLNDEGVGYVECSAAKAFYERDVFLDVKDYFSRIPNGKRPRVGDEIHFTVVVTSGNIPAATCIEIPRIDKRSIAHDLQSPSVAEAYLTKQAFRESVTGMPAVQLSSKMAKGAETPRMCHYCGKYDHQTDHGDFPVVHNEAWSVAFSRADDYWGQPHEKKGKDVNLHKPMEPRFNARYVNSLQEVKKKIRYNDDHPDYLVVSGAGLSIVNGNYVRGNVSDYRDTWMKEGNYDVRIRWSGADQAWLMDYTCPERGGRVAPYRLDREVVGAWTINEKGGVLGEPPYPTVTFKPRIGLSATSLHSTGEEDLPVSIQPPSQKPPSPLPWPEPAPLRSPESAPAQDVSSAPRGIPPPENPRPLLDVTRRPHDETTREAISQPKPSIGPKFKDLWL